MRTSNIYPTSAQQLASSMWRLGGYIDFTKHLYWHELRLIVLGPNVESLAGNRPSKLKFSRTPVLPMLGS